MKWMIYHHILLDSMYKNCVTKYLLVATGKGNTVQRAFQGDWYVMRIKPHIRSVAERDQRGLWVSYVSPSMW